LPSDVTEIYAFIATQTEEFTVADLCQTLGVSRSGYYAWQQRPATTDEMTPAVQLVFAQHGRRYGSRRITAELRARGCEIGRRRVRGIMQAEKLRAIQPRSFVPRTTNSRHGGRVSPHLLAELVVERPLQAWVSDITYLPLLNGQWAYLATWLDLYTRKIVGWAVAESMTADLIIRALKLALIREQPPAGLLVHSDRGGQYVDESYDNAHAESLFSRYKAELLEDGVFRDLAEAELETFEYIERYYNPIRLHSALGYTSPMKFERAYYQRAKTQSLNTKERNSR
jgi:putative transposase